jgi:uncharacterized protein YecE (DUF72 family)
MSVTVRIGCSGWIYRHWRELFYPAKLARHRWFAHYADTFSTVELNTSFYHLPKPETFAKWRDQAPPGFRYAVKAPRFITHMKKLKECAEPVEDFLALLPADVTHVFEFREKSWLSEDVLALLDARGVSFCAHDMPGAATPRWAAGPVAYVRFHGGTGKYVGRYPDETLLAWADWVVGQAEAGRDVWCYFNNDIGGHAIHDALTLRAMVGQVLRQRPDSVKRT